MTAIGTAVQRLEADFAKLQASLPAVGTLTAADQAPPDAAVSSLGASVSALSAPTASIETAEPAPAASATASS